MTAVGVSNSIKSSNYLDSDFHVIKPGETLTSISKFYNKDIKYLMTINAIKDPNKINIGSKLFLSEKNNSKNNTTNKEEIPKSDIRQFGPLGIDWLSLTDSGSSKIASAKNKDGYEFKIAINCKLKSLNEKDPLGDWKGWVNPIFDFEKQIIKEVCLLKN